MGANIIPRAPASPLQPSLASVDEVELGEESSVEELGIIGGEVLEGTGHLSAGCGCSPVALSRTVGAWAGPILELRRKDPAQLAGKKKVICDSIRERLHVDRGRVSEERRGAKDGIEDVIGARARRVVSRDLWALASQRREVADTTQAHKVAKGTISAASPTLKRTGVEVTDQEWGESLREI
jgi:hypothetical protein